MEIRGREEGLESRIPNGFMLEFPPQAKALNVNLAKKIMLREWLGEVSRFLNRRETVVRLEGPR